MLLLFCVFSYANLSAQQAGLQGRIWIESNNNCFFDANDRLEPNRIISLRNNNTGQTYYANTDTTGFYSLSVPAGTYNRRLNLPYNGLYFQALCTSFDTTIVLAASQIDTLNFPLSPLTSSGLARATLTHQRLQRCGPATLLLAFDNIGVSPILSLNAELKLDNYLSFSSAVSSTNISFTNNTNSNTVSINVRNINTNAVPQLLSINVNVSCDADLTQAHLSKLYLLNNDSLLIVPTYQGAILTVENDSCIGADSLQFKVRNIGAPTTQPYIVTQDNIMLRQSPAIFPSGGQPQTFTELSATGRTSRFEVKQPAGIPAVLGDSVAWAVAPACNANGKLNRFATWFYTGDATPFSDVACHSNADNFDDNFIQPSPLGYDASHFINQQTPLEYSLNFKNRLIVNANSVRLVCALDSSLDISTLEFHAASHAYTWQIFGGDSLQIQFSNLNLPPNGVGSVAFRIRPRANLPNGTVIFQNADISFNGNSYMPIAAVFHTIADTRNSFIQVLSFAHLQLAEISCKAYPNPATDYVTLEFSSPKSLGQSTLKIYNSLGQEVRNFTAADGQNQYIIAREQIPAGAYIYQLYNEQGGLVALGRIIFQ